MTINVSKDVENRINAAVRSGQFASPDEMIDKLVREYAERTRNQPGPALTLDELDRQMLADGLMSQLPNTAQDIDDEDEPPVEIEGEPLSETIIRERR